MSNDTYLKEHLAQCRTELRQFEKDRAVLQGKYETYEQELSPEQKAEEKHQNRLREWSVELSKLHGLIATRTNDIPRLEAAWEDAVRASTILSFQQAQAPHVERHRDPDAPKLPPPERPVFEGDPKELKNFARRTRDYLSEFASLGEAQKVRQVRAMLKGEARTWLDQRECDGDFSFGTHDELLDALRDAFGAFDEQEFTLADMMLLTPRRTRDGSVRAYVDAFRRMHNTLDKDNVPSFATVKAMFLLHVPDDTKCEMRTRLVGVTTTSALFETMSQLSHASRDAMDLDAFNKDKSTADQVKVHASKAPPHLRCHWCTGYGHFANECPSRVKHDPSIKTPPKN